MTVHYFINTLAKTTLIGAAVASLMASGTTYVEPPLKLTSQQANITRDGANSTKVSNFEEVSLTEKTNGILEFVKNGKTYSFSKADLMANDNNLYSKKHGDLTVYLQNSSKRNFEKFHNHTTKDVNLWFLNVDDVANNSRNLGYSVFGTISQVAPDTKTSLYQGRAEGYTVNRQTNDQFWLYGDINLSTDFSIGKQTITGEINNIRSQDQQNNNNEAPISNVVQLVNGKIANGKFTTEILTAENGVQVAVESGSVKGGFYGDKSNQAAGVGKFTTAKFETNFGFTANKK